LAALARSNKQTNPDPGGKTGGNQIEEKTMTAETTEICTRLNLETFCEQTNNIVTMLETVKSYGNAIASLSESLGLHNPLDYNFDYNLKKSVVEVNRDAWKHIINITGIKALCSIKKAKEIDDQIQKGTLPGLTPENVRSIVDSLSAAIPELIQESIREVFKWLRPSGYSAREFKTNQKAAELLQERLIVYAHLSSWRSNYEQQFRAMDNVFHMLDGKGPCQTTSQSSLLSAIALAKQKRENKCATPYFSCKWYGKGTFHIKFLRMDLVKRLNVEAAGMELHS